MNNTDGIILKKHHPGDSDASNELLASQAGQAFRLALSILDDASEAEEAAQDALVIALQRLDTFRQESTFRTWLYTVTLNVCRERLRKRRRSQRLQNTLQALFHIYHEPHPEEVVIKRESQSMVWHALQRLGDNERLAVILRYYHDLPIAQVAQVLQVSERTVYKRLETAHTRLQVLLSSKTGTEK